MTRPLDTATLDQAGQDYAAWFMADRKPFDRDYVMRQFWQFTFKDEFEHMIKAVRSNLGPGPLKNFDARVSVLKAKDPRTDKVFHGLLADKLAITPDGEHIGGKVGSTKLGARVVGKGVTLRGNPKNLYSPIYAGEEEERTADSGVADPLTQGV